MTKCQPYCTKPDHLAEIADTGNGLTMSDAAAHVLKIRRYRLWADMARYLSGDDVLEGCKSGVLKC